MRRTKIRAAFVVALSVVTMFALVATIWAASVDTQTYRTITAIDNSLSIEVASLGNAGAIHGNVSYWTSPVDASGSFEWFNQDVSVSFPLPFPDLGNNPIFSAATVARNMGSGYGPYTPFAEPFNASFEGVYSIIATGTSDTGDISGEITPAFGIDKTDPVITTDRVPFYAGTPTVTLTATDTMSGVESVLITDNSQRMYSVEPDPSDPSNFSVPMSFVGAGIHTIKWVGFDNAGNAVSGSEMFTIDNTPPTTTSDALSDYNGQATIKLMAADDVGGSGVAHTYYILDGAPQVEGTTVSVPAPATGFVNHTLEFWSEDAVGNVETPAQTVEFTVNSRDTFEPNNDIASATSLAFPGSVNSYLSTQNDHDVYKIYVAGPGNIRLRLAPPSGLGCSVTLRDSAGVSLTTASGAAGVLVDNSYSFATAGYYYVDVYRYADASYTVSNTYTLTLSVPTDTLEPNNTVASATTLAFPGTVWSYLSTRNDHDIYKVYVSKPGNMLLRMTPPSGMGGYFALRDSVGTTLATAGGSADVAIETAYSFTTAGYYYVDVYRNTGAAYSTGSPYRLTLSVPTDTKEPNNDIAHAASFSATGTENSYLSTRNDHDIYKVNIPAPGNHVFSVTPPAGLGVRLVIRNASGSPLASLNGTTDTPVEVSYSFSSTGYYYIDVYRCAGASYSLVSAYTLNMQ